jgi:hypothetical protein
VFGSDALTKRVHLEIELPCSSGDAWQQVVRSDMLKEVSRPLIRFSEIGGHTLPDTWQQGSTIRIKCWLFGVIPLATRTLLFERVDDDAREIQTREHDRMIRRWDHLIAIRKGNGETALYSDTVEIDAGLLTLPVWLFAQWFYRHRQRRWLRIAKRLNHIAA